MGSGGGVLVGGMLGVVVAAKGGAGELVGVSGEAVEIELPTPAVNSAGWMAAGCGPEVHPTEIKIVNTKNRARRVILISSPRT